MTIREYKESDWESLVKIHDSARMTELENANLEEAFVPLEVAAENEGLFEYRLYVAEEKGEVVGFTAFTEDELAWLYVEPSKTRQGIGKALVQFVIDSTKKRPLNIEVLCKNEPALKLYEKMGFKTIEAQTGKMPGNESFTVSVHCMELR